MHSRRCWGAWKCFSLKMEESLEVMGERLWCRRSSGQFINIFVRQAMAPDWITLFEDFSNRLKGIARNWVVKISIC